MAGTRKPTPLAPLYGRIGGLRLAATHDPKVYTAAARRVFAESFERQVDPDRVLPPRNAPGGFSPLRRPTTPSLPTDRP
jgi:hypothetical protein